MNYYKLVIIEVEIAKKKSKINGNILSMENGIRNMEYTANIHKHTHKYTNEYSV